MMSHIVKTGVLFAASYGAQASSRNVASVTPIQKVLELMDGMLEKGIAEKKSEEVKYTAFNQWCGDQTRIRNDEIAAGDAEIERLNAFIEKSESEIRQLTDRIDELDADVGRWTKDKASAADVRDKEAVDFKATVLDYTESIDAIAGAIQVLKKQSSPTAQAEALIQVTKQRLVPAAAKKALTALLQQPDEMLFREAPEAYGYEFQSGGVVDMLLKLQDEFTTKKRELEFEEMNAQHAFEQMTQQLVDNIENAEHEISKKKQVRADTQAAKAEAEGDLADTEKARAEDQTYLDDMTALCNQKAADFASRQELRAQEIGALQKAIEVISSKTVAGAGEKYLPSASFVQRRASALVQVKSGESSPWQQRAASFLADAAQSSGSRLLSEAAQRVAADPFVKVKKMVKDLISKLMEEATSETEHKGWCDAELAKNKQTRESRTQDVADLTAEIEDLTATIAQLTQDVADLAAAVKELDDAMAASTAERTESKATNEQTIKEAKEAQAAVEEATAVVKDYYAKSAEATAFAQQSQTPGEDAPETFDKPYQGMLPEGGNVVDFLEVILSDFVRLESETAATEAAEQDEFETFMFESKKDKALKQNESGHKANKKTNKESALHSAEEELKLNEDQLKAANDYYDKLKPDCVDSGINYEERVKLREAEIQSLQEALKILQGQDLPTMG